MQRFTCLLSKIRISSQFGCPYKDVEMHRSTLANMATEMSKIVSCGQVSSQYAQRATVCHA
eukprot:6185757-Pleurochrysis_carterae.AAC.2